MLQLRDIAPEQPVMKPVLEPGDLLGVYAIEKILGEGSMGRVYLARHTRLGRHVALKVLHHELLRDNGLVQRFLQEGRVVNRISHEHIVEVHDFVEEPGRVYCVMELLVGETLTQRMARAPLTVAQIRHVARQLASALGAAHAEGVVHRDLKPDNILLVTHEGDDTWVKVLDFGVAKTVGVNELKLFESQQGALLGTPLYMAPEQAAGLDIDARTDIYALGTVFYELISGATPFDADAFGQLAADIITRAPAPLPETTTAGEEVPEDLATIIMQCLEKKPDDRPASMKLLEARLALPGSRPRWQTRSMRWGAAAMVLFAMGAFAFSRNHHAEAAPVKLAEMPAQAVIPTSTLALNNNSTLDEPQMVPVDPSKPKVTLRIHSEPEGATVFRSDTQEVIGHTPFELQVPRSGQKLGLRFELNGFHPLERTVKTDESQRIEFSLKATARPRKARPITDGVLEAY